MRRPRGKERKGDRQKRVVDEERSGVLASSCGGRVSGNASIPGRIMMAAAVPHLAAMRKAAEREWQDNASADWTTIDFWRWPRGFHRSAWTIAAYIGWNPLDVLDHPTPAGRAVNALLTRQCVILTIMMTRHVPDPTDPAEPLLAWFNAAAREHQHDIAETVEALGDADWKLPTSRRWAARRLVKMWEQGGAAAFHDLSGCLVNKPAVR